MKEDVLMKDENIIRLYWDRDETAIKETSDKYGKYCFAIANNILGSREIQGILKDIVMTL